MHTKQNYRTQESGVVELVCLANSFVISKPDSVYLVLKRLIDQTAAIVALIVTFPILALACLAIKLETPGPVIYRQKRRGAGGKEFLMYKLRTMQCNSEGQNFTTNWKDPRITTVGFVLRKTKIDEMPQFWNVLKGDMSLIGPRPLSVKEVDYLATEAGFSYDFPGLLPKQRPGLIGLEQVNRTRKLTYEERFFLNDVYETNLDASMDLGVFFKSLGMCRYVCWAAAVGGLFECLFGYLLLS